MPDGSAPPSAPPCLFCGASERVAIFEIWGSHEFMLETCCEGLYATLVADMDDDPAWAGRFLQDLAIENLAGHRLRRLTDDGACGMLLDRQLEIGPVSFREARAFIARHHAHCGAPAAWRFGASIWNGRTMLGVVMVGNPVAPGLCGRGVLEVNRLCTQRDIPRVLAWNATSMLYGWSARQAQRRGWRHIVT